MNVSRDLIVFFISCAFVGALLFWYGQTVESARVARERARDLQLAKAREAGVECPR
jgi:hypothetical protein